MLQGVQRGGGGVSNGQVREVEDVMHFLLYCGCYATVRAKYSRLLEELDVSRVAKMLTCLNCCLRT